MCPEVLPRAICKSFEDQTQCITSCRLPITACSKALAMKAILGIPVSERPSSEHGSRLLRDINMHVRLWVATSRCNHKFMESQCKRDPHRISSLSILNSL